MSKVLTVTPPRLLSIGVHVDGGEGGLSVVGERVHGCHDMVTGCDLAVWCAGRVLTGFLRLLTVVV